jgi:hypothetical protein
VLFEKRPIGAALVNGREVATVVPSIAPTIEAAGTRSTEGVHVGGCGAVRECCKGADLLPAKGRSVRGRGLAHAIGATFLFAVLSTTGSAPSGARDRIALPFTCTIEHGRLHVEAAAQQIYAITSHRDQQSFTYCPVGEGDRCRTWMVHRFVVQCAGGRASWPEIVAAGMGRGPFRPTIEGGQLLLRLGARRGDAAERWCYEGDHIPGRAKPGWTRCGPAGNGGLMNAMRTHIVALPRGFAPLGLVGARVLIDTEPPRPPVAAQLTATEPVLPAASQPSLPAVTIEPLEPVTPPLVPMVEAPAEPTPQPAILPPLPPIAMPISTAPSWKPWIEITPANAAREEPAAVAPDRVAKLFALLLLASVSLLATGALLRRRPAPLASPADRSAGLGEAEAPRAVALRAKAEGHISLINSSLDRLTTVAPLRNALARDLQASERRLAVVMAGISSSRIEPAAWARARRRLERIAQDLDRLQQIAESAVSSMLSVRAQSELPRNKDEAYVALGVTAGVSEPILKKLVEALRISWHPDLARNDEERAAREIRIKEINVAWDLITGKRPSE